MTDEECIVTMLLHGGHLWWDRDAEANNGTHWMRQHKQYYAIDAGFSEHASCLYPDNRRAYSQGESPGGAAREYCRRHELLLEEDLFSHAVS